MSLVYEPPSLWCFVIAALRQIYSGSCPHRSQEKVGGGHVGEARGSVRRQREGANMGRSLYCGFWGEEQVRQGQQAQDGLVWVISGSGAQELPLVVWYPALALRVGGQWPGE